MTLFSRQITKYVMSLVLSLVFISVSGCAPMQEKPKAKEQTTSKSKLLEARFGSTCRVEFATITAAIDRARWS